MFNFVHLVHRNYAKYEMCFSLKNEKRYFEEFSIL